MRILYLADIRFPLERANGIQTMETCYALAERGHAITLVVRRDRVSPRRDPFAFYGLAPQARLVIEQAWVNGPAVTRRVGYLAYALSHAVARARYDVILTRDLGVAAALLRVPGRLRPPVVYESHGLASVFAEQMPSVVTGTRPASRLKQRRLLGRERRVWQRAEGYITITHALAADLLARFGPRDRVATIPDGVRLDATRCFVPLQARAVPVVTYVGHLYPWKGAHLLLSALAELPGVRGVVAGGHPAEVDLPRMQALAASLGLADRVTFTGWVERSRIPAFLAEADVLVLPNTSTPISLHYTSPLKLFEYMAAGKPIVASDLPAIREILKDGHDACLVEPGNAHALAVAIRRVLDDRALAERIARTAFDEAAAYTWARRAERIEQVLHTAAERR